MTEENAARQLRPFQKVVRDLPKDFRPGSTAKPVFPYEDLRPEGEETEAPDPKEESAPESADSSTSTPTGAPSGSETTVPTPANKDTGKPKESESSSQTSSSEKNPGWSEPPVPAKPPTKE